MFRRSFLLILAGGLLTACAPSAPKNDVTYYLVRHAEKTAEKPDPALTDAGMFRAIDLGNRLRDVALTAIYATDYTRTRDTAKPVSDMQELPVQIYDPKDLRRFAESLKTQTGHILIVGHSNTTPQLAELLGGEAGGSIDDATEFNRFYVIKKSSEDVTSDIQRYGR